MKISVVQQNYIIGDIAGNTQKILDAIAQGKQNQSDLLVFSELCVSGYPPRDFLYFEDFIEKCENAIEEITSATDDIAIIIGSPTRNLPEEGKPLFNSALFIQNQKLQATIHKTLLPTYDVFDENRYFEKAKEWSCIEILGTKIAVTICEDIWNFGIEIIYPNSPMDYLISEKPDLMINLSASPFDYTHAEDRKAILRANTEKYKIPMVYCNSVGSQTEIVFDGGSIVMSAESDILAELKYFEEDMETLEFEDGRFKAPILTPASEIPTQELDPEDLDFDLNIDRVYRALVIGIREYFSKMGFKKAILGASGGIDSAVTQALAVEALGAENVKSLLMPSQFSTSHSVDDAVALCQNLQNPYEIIEIKPIYEQFMDSLKPAFGDLEFNIAEENIQSRSRGVLLMAESNKFGYILLNTSNKSELAVGYGTLYGDMAGGFSVLGDVYKMQVFSLANYINREKEIIPNHIITKPPSAELRPDQKDSDSLPEYTDLDAILYQYIERQLSPADIIELGFEKELVYRIIQMVNRNEYKRAQFCPIIRISPKSFGIGRRIPIVAHYLD